MTFEQFLGCADSAKHMTKSEGYRFYCHTAACQCVFITASCDSDSVLLNANSARSNALASGCLHTLEKHVEFLRQFHPVVHCCVSTWFCSMLLVTFAQIWGNSRLVRKGSIWYCQKVEKNSCKPFVIDCR